MRIINMRIINPSGNVERLHLAALALGSPTGPRRLETFRFSGDARPPDRSEALGSQQNHRAGNVTKFTMLSL